MKNADQKSSAASDVTIQVDGVGKKFCRDLKRSLRYGMADVARELVAMGGAKRNEALREGEFWATRDVSFELRRGEALGLIGRNGAGKTTLLRMLNGLIKPDAGDVQIRGEVGAMIALGAGFNPVLSGRENIFVNAAILGLTKAQTDARMDEIIDFAEIREAIEAPVQTYSSGMQVRLGYAVMASIKPEVLLVDEVLAVGDAAFQRKCIASMRGYVKAGGSLVLVAHNMHAIQSVCNRCAVLDGGRLVYLGSTNEGISRYYAATQAARSNPASGSNAAAGAVVAPASKVTIEGVMVGGGSGPQVSSGAALKIKLSYRAAAPVAGVAWGFSVWSDDQQVRLGTATSSWDAVKLDLPAGTGVLEAVWPNCPLVAGAYHLKGGIYDADTSWPLRRFGWDDAPVPFRVEGRTSEADNRRISDGDLIVLDVAWK